MKAPSSFFLVEHFRVQTVTNRNTRNTRNTVLRPVTLVTLLRFGADRVCRPTRG